MGGNFYKIRYLWNYIQLTRFTSVRNSKCRSQGNCEWNDVRIHFDNLLLGVIWNKIVFLSNHILSYFSKFLVILLVLFNSLQSILRKILYLPNISEKFFLMSLVVKGELKCDWKQNRVAYIWPRKLIRIRIWKESFENTEWQFLVKFPLRNHKLCWVTFMLYTKHLSMSLMS